MLDDETLVLHILDELKEEDPAYRKNYWVYRRWSAAQRIRWIHFLRDRSTTLPVAGRIISELVKRKIVL